MSSIKTLTLLLAFAACLGAGGCGAGLIGAIAAGSNNNSDPPPSEPELDLTEPRIPLVQSTNAASNVRTVVVTNAQVPANSDLRVQLRALGLPAVDQLGPVIVSGQGNSIVIGFGLDTAPFVQALGDPSQGDVQGELAVLVDGREVAPPVPVLLLRQPEAELEQASRLNLSPLGGTRATLRVRWLHETAAGDLQMSVVTRDATGQASTVTRLCTNLTLQTIDPTTALVSATVPGNTFAGPAELLVDGLVSGRSKTVGDLYDPIDSAVVYRPEITVALPSQGPTTGGTLVTLIGTALVPLDFGFAPPRPDFDDVQLLFRKGTPMREVSLLQSELRTGESSLDRLVFTMPPSPDGRPGQVDIVLRSLAGGAQSDLIADRVFLYANPQPVFGPRGAGLDRQPVAVTPILLEAAAGGNEAPDFGILYSEGGVAFLQLLMAEENGMFIRFGQPQRIGDPEQISERDPRDVTAGDFDADNVPDFAIANAGAAVATGHIVQGRAAPSPPLGPITRITTDPAAARCESADFDEDGVPDLVLLPAADAPAGSLPRVMLARPAGGPAFVPGAPVPVRPVIYDSMAVADLDGDQHLDIAVATGGSQLRLDVAFGDGMGGFSASSQLDFQVPGYLPHPASAAVGLHAVGGGPQRSLAIVLAGLPPPGTQLTPPVVAVLRHLSPRVFLAPLPTNVLIGLLPIGHSLVANLDAFGPEEMVLAVAGDISPLPLVLLQYTGSNFQLVAAQDGSAGMLSVASMHFGVAFPADVGLGRPAANAVFVVHDSVTDGVREKRLSTMLVFRPPQGTAPLLLAPDAGGAVALPVFGLLAGNYSAISAASGGATRDLALAMVDAQQQPQLRQIQLLNNEGFGGFPSPGIVMREDLLVPETMALVPAAAGAVDTIACFTTDGHIGLWQPDEQGPPLQHWTSLSPLDLRQLLPNPVLRVQPVGAGSRLRAVDVEGDGVADLVALLTFAAPPLGEGEALLLILRGKPSPAAGEFPFEMPASSAVATRTHGNASDFTLGDFVPEGSGAPVRLELALAIPRGDNPGAGNGDHLRFYLLEAGSTPAEDFWLRSFDQGGAQVLLAGNEPTRLCANDFDGNGTVDLMVAAAGDASLRLFLNSGLPASDPREVSIEAFHESFTSPYAAASGEPTFLNQGDINGDGIGDVLLTTESVSSSNTRSSSIASYLSTGTGDFLGPTFVPRSRLGDRDAQLSVDLADFNGDGVPDLPLTWSTPALAGRNVLVLFGGSR